MIVTAAGVPLCIGKVCSEGLAVRWQLLTLAKYRVGSSILCIAVTAPDLPPSALSWSCHLIVLRSEYMCICSKHPDMGWTNFSVVVVRKYHIICTVRLSGAGSCFLQWTGMWPCYNSLLLGVLFLQANLSEGDQVCGLSIEAANLAGV